MMSPRGPARTLSLRWKLPLIVVALMALIIVASLGAAWYEVRATTRRAAADRLSDVTRQFAGRLELQLQGYANRVATLAREPSVLSALGPAGVARDSALAALLLSDRGVLAAELLDADGVRRWGTGAHLDAIRALIPADPRALIPAEDSTRIGALLALGDTLTFASVAAVRLGATRVGYLVLWPAIRPDSNARQVIATVIGSSARVYIGSPGGGWTDQAGAVAGPPAPIDSLGAPRVYARPGLGEQFAVGTPVRGGPWVVLTEFPLAIVMAPANKFLGRAVLLGFVLLLLGASLAAVVSQRLIGPLIEVTAASDAMAAGDHRVRVSTTRRADELGRLGVAFNGMAERVEAEVSARIAAEDQWRLLFRANPHPMWVSDIETFAFLTVNDAAIARYGWSREEFLAMTILDIQPAEDVEKVRVAAAQHPDRAILTTGWRHQDRHGTVFDVEISSSEVPFDGRIARLTLATDISARADLERQLRQAQKMEAVGRLAAGVAHDFNNSLAVIFACADLLRSELDAIGHPTEDLKEIARAAERAAALTRQLLTFSRQRPLHPVVLDPNLAIQEVERLARRTFGEEISVQTRQLGDVGLVRMDAGHLEQVLLNLAMNARDAMPNGGSITLATDLAQVDESSLALHGLERVGDYVVLSVTDTGVGMAREVQARLFEPFFTTKEIGKGTGLGLATAYGIVTGADGAITVYSEPGAGSTFRVYLPQVKDVGAQAANTPPATAVVAGGTESVLLVEDDLAVRSATATVLRRLGYHVLEADGPATALAIADDSAHHFDMVVSDVVMPGMSGPQLLDRLRVGRPSLRALLMSGYAGDAIAERGVIANGTPLLEKPFTMRALAAAVRKILDE